MNFQTIIQDMQDAGYTQKQIAKLCGCSQASVSDLLTGAVKDPRYSTGATLLLVHKQALRKLRKPTPPL